jgi:hypothetical protein
MDSLQPSRILAQLFVPRLLDIRSQLNRISRTVASMGSVAFRFFPPDVGVYGRENGD